MEKCRKQKAHLPKGGGWERKGSERGRTRERGEKDREKGEGESEKDKERETKRERRDREESETDKEKARGRGRGEAVSGRFFFPSGWQRSVVRQSLCPLSLS